MGENLQEKNQRSTFASVLGGVLLWFPFPARFSVLLILGASFLFQHLITRYRNKAFLPPFLYYKYSNIIFNGKGFIKIFQPKTPVYNTF